MREFSGNSKNRGPITQKMLAEYLGYSQETVSHILSNGPRKSRYSERTRERVLEAARELGYRPHRGAQLMRSGKSNLIGVIHFGSSYEVAQQTAKVLPAELKARGYRVLVVDLGWEGDSAKGAVDQLIEARVEGVIITQMVESFGKKEVELLRKAGVPVITIAGNEKLGVPGVCSEVRGAMAQMVKHLASLKHRRMMLLMTDYNSRPDRERINGFKDGVEALGGKIRQLDGSPESVGDWLREAKSGISGALVCLTENLGLDNSSTAYTYARPLFSSELVPDVFVCCNDQWARGVFSAALEAGWPVPEKVAITGIDNEAFGSYPPYYLTTIAQSRKEECKKAVELLIDLIEGRTLQKQMTTFPARLIIRRSCGAPESEVGHPIA